MSDQNYSSEVLLSDKILLDLLPEKRGFIKKHAEYLVTYNQLGTQVEETPNRNCLLLD
jgi:hypothetical protein